MRIAIKAKGRHFEYKLSVSLFDNFESRRVAPLFDWVATLGKLFTHIVSPVSQLQETGVQKEVFGA